MRHIPSTPIIGLLLVVAIAMSVAPVRVAALEPHSDIGCSFCHVPHGGDGDNSEVPLWAPNRTTTSLTGNYSNPGGTLDATVGAPDGASKLCLACHDGAFSFVSDDHTFGPGEQMGDLQNSHPISFVYDQQLATDDGELVDPLTLEPDVLDGNGKMQCVSCHDVHSQVVDTGKLLRWSVYDGSVDGSTSGFCRHCHLK